MPPLVEFNVAVVVEPMSEILSAASRLLLQELPCSQGPSAPEAPDPIAPGELQGALKGSTLPWLLSLCWDRCIGVQEGGSCMSPPCCSFPSVHPMISLHLCSQQLGDITLHACPCHPQARCSLRRQW